jgi:hypothetical protein
MKKAELIKIIKEETSNLLFEQENWDELTKVYYKIRMNASGGNAGQLTMRRVRQHVAKAKSMTDGYAKLVAYIKKKYPEEQLAQNLSIKEESSNILEQAPRIIDFNGQPAIDTGTPKLAGAHRAATVLGDILRKHLKEKGMSLSTRLVKGPNGNLFLTTGN